MGSNAPRTFDADFGTTAYGTPREPADAVVEGLGGTEFGEYDEQIALATLRKHMLAEALDPTRPLSHEDIIQWAGKRKATVHGILAQAQNDFALERNQRERRRLGIPLDARGKWNKR